MTYGAGTWTLTAQVVHKFKLAHQAMERGMLRVSLQDRLWTVASCSDDDDEFILVKRERFGGTRKTLLLTPRG
jgi:hypothetical protein